MWSICDLRKQHIWVSKKVIFKCSSCRIATTILHEMAHLYSQNVTCKCPSCGNPADTSYTKSVNKFKYLEIPAFLIRDVPKTNISPCDVESEICLNKKVCIFCQWIFTHSVLRFLGIHFFLINHIAFGLSFKFFGNLWNTLKLKRKTLCLTFSYST